MPCRPRVWKTAAASLTWRPCGPPTGCLSACRGSSNAFAISQRLGHGRASSWNGPRQLVSTGEQRHLSRWCGTPGGGPPASWRTSPVPAGLRRQREPRQRRTGGPAPETRSGGPVSRKRWSAPGRRQPQIVAQKTRRQADAPFKRAGGPAPPEEQAAIRGAKGQAAFWLEGDGERFRPGAPAAGRQLHPAPASPVGGRRADLRHRQGRHGAGGTTRTAIVLVQAGIIKTRVPLSNIRLLSKRQLKKKNPGLHSDQERVHPGGFLQPGPAGPDGGGGPDGSGQLPGPGFPDAPVPGDHHPRQRDRAPCGQRCSSIFGGAPR